MLIDEVDQAILKSVFTSDYSWNKLDSGNDFNLYLVKRNELKILVNLQACYAALNWVYRNNLNNERYVGEIAKDLLKEKEYFGADIVLNVRANIGVEYHEEDELYNYAEVVNNIDVRAL